MRKSKIYLGEDNPNYGNKGESNPLFKGGRLIDSAGYVVIYMPGHPNSRFDGYVLEHRLVMSNHLGRPLTDGEQVHHIDGNKKNNSIRNLELTYLSEHTSHHNKGITIFREESGRFRHVVKAKNLGSIK